MPAAVVWAVGYLAEYGIISAATAVAVGTFAATYGTVIMVVGGLAYSAAKAREAKSLARDAYNAAQVDRMANVTSTKSPRDLVLGRVRKAGTVFYKASTGAHQSTLYLAIAVAGHEIDAIETIYINDVEVTLDVSGNVTTAPYQSFSTITADAPSISGPFIDTPVPGSIVQPDPSMSGVLYQYVVTSSHINITKHLGAPGQVVDASLAAAFPADWSANNVVEGVAYMVVRLAFSDNAFPQGVPNITSVVRGAKLYDPRTATTVWSENPALMVRHVYQHSWFGKAAVTAAEDARFIAAANACDTSTVYTVDGVPQAACALYRAALVAPYGTAARSLFDDLSQAMGGSWAFAGGELYLKPGVYTASVMSITDADLAVINRTGAEENHSPIKISVHKERAQKFNSVKSTIWDAGQHYKQVTLAPLTSATLVARDGVELVQQVAFPAIGYAPQAQHVAGVMMRDARDALVLEVPLKLRAYPLELFDTIDLTLPRYGWVGKTFMILGRQWMPDGSISLSLKETSASITQVDADFSAQGFASNTNLPAPWDVAPPGTLVVTSGTAELLSQSDGTITSRMRVSWPTVPDAGVVQGGNVEVQYRATDSLGAWTSLIVPGNETSVVTADVQDGMGYIVRARSNNLAAVSDWGLQVLHQVVGKTEPPPPFDFFTVMVQPDGTRQYNFGYNALADQPVDWLGAEIRYISGSVGAPDWDLMTPLQDATTYYTSSPVELNAPLAGAYTFACKSIDTTGNLSTYLVYTNTLSDRRLGNVFDEVYEDVEGWLGTLTSCHVQDGYLQANDPTTWATLPATWDAWTAWSMAPASPIVYETPVRDFGTVVAGQVNSTIDADGTVVQELATSADGTTWSAWGSAAAAFSSRYVKLRITVTATGPAPVPVVRAMGWQINAPLKSESINDIDIATLTGSYRIGVGDVRIPLAGTYTILKRTSVVIQDGSAGTWTSTRIDQAMTYGPRWQFRLNGTLADPDFVDFYIEGY